jgi:hypothetical protein
MEKGRDLDSYRHEHFHHYSALNSSTQRPSPTQPQSHFISSRSGVSHSAPSAPGISFSTPPATTSIPLALSSGLSGLTSPPIHHNSKPTVAFNHANNPEGSISQMHQSHMLSIPRDNFYASSSLPSYTPTQSFDKGETRDINKVTMTQYSQYSSNKIEPTGNASIPSFQ